jgi:hypothetical protein
MEADRIGGDGKRLKTSNEGSDAKKLASEVIELLDSDDSSDKQQQEGSARHEHDDDDDDDEVMVVDPPPVGLYEGGLIQRHPHNLLPLASSPKSNAERRCGGTNECAMASTIAQFQSAVSILFAMHRLFRSTG